MSDVVLAHLSCCEKLLGGAPCDIGQLDTSFCLGDGLFAEPQSWEDCSIFAAYVAAQAYQGYMTFVSVLKRGVGQTTKLRLWRTQVQQTVGGSMCPRRVRE
jgi:hypothetical protein